MPLTRETRDGYVVLSAPLSRRVVAVNRIATWVAVGCAVWAVVVWGAG